MNPTAANLFLDTDRLEWTRATDYGVRAKLLHRDAVTGARTLLVEFAPGARIPSYDPHPNGEEVYVLRGTFVDGDHVCPAGTFIHYPPGSGHQPHSDEGCLIYVTIPAAGNFSA